MVFALMSGAFGYASSPILCRDFPTGVHKANHAQKAPAEDNRLSRQRWQTMMGLDISMMNRYTMHQCNNKATLIDAIRRRSGAEVDRGVVPVALDLDESLIDDPDAYPLKVQLRYLPRDELVIWRTNAHSMRPDGKVQAERGVVESVIRSSSTIDDTLPVISGEESSIKPSTLWTVKERIAGCVDSWNFKWREPHPMRFGASLMPCL
ncbi:hypothetical protein EYZ11_012858 [Aspergillus tanneri]|uniref:Uncharacterized protein n=1 Tax=Aspergillus tanneri TaxID=1220188 RepID=A0A4S3IZM3_9EURO|nr:hypothetical protein EYZ11_012858 [Aspergillus tanneri]